MITRISVFRLALSMTIFTPASVWAALPLITDEAGTVGKGHYQLEVNGQYDHNEEHRVTTTGGQIDPIFSYGITDSIDLVVITPN